MKKIVAPLTNRLIIPSKTVLKSVAKGEATCSDFYPVQCTSTDYTYDTCASKSAINATVGLITCSKKTGHCPSFFQGTGGTEGDDLASGWVCFILSIVFLVCCLFGLVKVLSTMLGGVSSKMIAKATNIPGIASMAVGCLITILVQSSSITTSVLTPLAGMDLIKLEQMYPMTLGANLGTTMTAIMAAMVSDQVEVRGVGACKRRRKNSGGAGVSRHHIYIYHPHPYQHSTKLICKCHFPPLPPPLPCIIPLSPCKSPLPTCGSTSLAFSSGTLSPL